MAATIKIKNSSTAGAAPTSSDLVQGELAVNVTDKRLYTENSGGTIVELGTNPSVPVTFPDGSASAPSLTNSGDTNTGMFFPAADTIAFAEGGTESMRLDSSGNLGLGVTPSAWGSNTAIDITSWSAIGTVPGNGATVITNNAYYNSGGSPRYKLTGFNAAAYSQSISGIHSWSTAGTGTAGNAITFTQAMTLDASGNLLVNTTTAREKITVNGSIAASGQLIPYSGSTSLGYIGNDSSISGGSGSNIGLRSEAAMLFATGGSTERARIDSSGNFLVGTTTASSTTGTTIRPDGVIISKGVYNELVTASTRAIYMDSSGYFGYISSTRDSKTNINALSDVNWLYSLNPVSFNYKKIDKETNTRLDEAEEEMQYGLIAEDTAQVNDALCFYDTTENGGELRGIAYEKLVVPMLKAIQEQQAIITQLQADVAALKGQA